MRVALFSSIIFWLILQFVFYFSHFRESHLLMKGRIIHKFKNPQIRKNPQIHSQNPQIQIILSNEKLHD